jgi:hypothetical protein
VQQVYMILQYENSLHLRYISERTLYTSIWIFIHIKFINDHIQKSENANYCTSMHAYINMKIVYTAFYYVCVDI